MFKETVTTITCNSCGKVALVKDNKDLFISVDNKIWIKIKSGSFSICNDCAENYSNREE